MDTSTLYALARFLVLGLAIYESRGIRAARVAVILTVYAALVAENLVKG